MRTIAVPVEETLACMNAWSLDALPRWNRRVLDGTATADMLVEALRREILAALPPAECLSPRQAKQCLVHLGLYGASVARHAQEADPTLTTAPEHSFDTLAAGEHGCGFLDYFAQAADRTGTGHPPRDAFASLVRWNSPAVSVSTAGTRTWTLPSAFDDGRYRTYLGDPDETRFFALLKDSEAVEKAVNDLLAPISAGDLPPADPEALANVRYATELLAVLHRLNLDFAADEPHRGMNTDFFIDILRQFATHWRTDDIPPSGAQDTEYLKRDLLLGINLPHYHQHIKRQYPALLPAERQELDELAGRPSIPALLLGSFGPNLPQLDWLPPTALASLLAEHPEAAPYYFLLHLNHRVSSSHLMLTKKFLFKPARLREQQSIPDTTLVSSHQGTTGMLEARLEQLAQARKHHALAPLAHIGRRHLLHAAGLAEEPRIPTAQLSRHLRHPAHQGPDQRDS